MSTAILDNVEKINAIDKSGMLNFCINAPEHYRKAAAIAQKISVNLPKPDNIIISGLGGSAIGGDLLKDWARDKAAVPIEEVNREYHLPVYAGKKTLVIISSYSGETEESLSAFLEALKRKCIVYCVSSGGALLKYAIKHKVPYLQVPGGMPPRAALPYMFIPLVIFMQKTGLVTGVSVELDESLKLLEKICGENLPQKPVIDNLAKTLALDIGETVPVIYGFGFYRGVAQRFKQQINENAKYPAKWEVFPELNHNEIVGWANSGDSRKGFSVIFLRDADEPMEIRSRIETTKQIMGNSGLKMADLQSQGTSTLAKMLSTILVGDFTSNYLAVLHGVDPTPVEVITHLKGTLQQNGFKEKIIKELEEEKVKPQIL